MNLSCQIIAAYVFNSPKPPHPTKVLHYREIRAIAREQFINDINTSDLIRREFDDVNEVTNVYNDTHSKLLDKHAPLK